MALPKERKLEHQRQLAAVEDFRKEIRCRCIYDGAPADGTTLHFALSAGISEASGYNYMKDPTKIRVKAMREVVKNLRPDIGVVLRLLGYTNQDIKAYAKSVLQ